MRRDHRRISAREGTGEWDRIREGRVRVEGEGGSGRKEQKKRRKNKAKKEAREAKGRRAET